MNKILLFIMSLYVPQLFAGPDTMTISNLLIADEEDAQVCYDGVTGKLGNCSAAATAKPKRIAWVSQEGGGDYDDPIAAMNDLAAWCNAPSSTNGCLLRIGPGNWDLVGSLNMVSYVDIQGSGMEITQLSGDVSSDVSGLVNGASYAALKDLHVTNNSSGTWAAAIEAHDNFEFRIQRVHANTLGEASLSYALRAQNLAGSIGETQVFVEDSRLEAGSSGSNRSIYLLGATANFLAVSVARSTLNTSSVGTPYAVFATTTTGSSIASVGIRDSLIYKTLRVSGNGASNIRIRSSNMRDVEDTAGSGSIFCSFVLVNSVALTDTCS